MAVHPAKASQDIAASFVLLAATLIALVIANTELDPVYSETLNTRIALNAARSVSTIP